MFFPEGDEDLLLQMNGGSRTAFTRIYNYYQPRLFRYLAPFTYQDTVLAEEVVQEVFIKLWMRRRDLLHVKALEPYLQKMAQNQYLDTVKLRRIKDRHELLSAQGRGEWVDETENHLCFKEYYQLTKEAIALLPERRRYLFQLSTVEGYSLDEIAVLTNLSKAVVKKQLTLTHQFLRKHLQEKGGFPIQASLWLLCSILVDLK